MDDDRVGFHQRVSLEQAGHICAFASYVSPRAPIPDRIICDTPKAIRIARKAFGRKVQIIYDVTEWYPSKKYLWNVPAWRKPLMFCAMIGASLWAGCATNAFIFGEAHKAKPFRRLFPWKKYLFLPYYPSLQYIPSSAPRPIEDEVRLFYAGPKTQEKGYFRAIEVAKKCETKMPGKKVVFTAVEGVSFEDFCREITLHDFCLDLRDNDFENTRCLPIKLFYYLAAGKPVVYSDLKAIRHGVPEIVNDSLVDPDDIERAADSIVALTSSPEKYLAICRRNRELAESTYNWESQHERFVQFVEQL